MSSDRNLLLGMLALNAGLITREELLVGFQTWMLDRDRPLAKILRDQDVLDDDDRLLLEGLLERQLKRHGDARRSLASLRVDPEARSDLERLADADVQASLAVVPGGAETPRPEMLTPPPQDTEVPWDRVPSPAVLRYRRLRSHARGGLGEVFVALDTELQREVALKEIQERWAGDLGSRQRFVREAEVTGNLEHPGIVPIYGLGIYPDGRPVYAMRFIHGESLHEAIRRFHQADEKPDRDPAERSLALRELLTRFVAVCNAVGYAHARGVIHRDLKPANIMLGEFGETLVVDWGLARLLTEPVGELTTPQDPLHLTGSDTPATAPGAVVGTPAYMPPEQARGEHDRVEERSDVWALGAILYAILTGKPPYDGREAVQRAGRCEFVPPEQSKRGVPRPLEAVCLHAMAAQPEQRYPRARTLAQDVERWLADEPVSVHREPLRERVRRWGRRHRTLVSSLMVLLGAGVVGLSVGLWAVGREKAQTERALVQADENLALARRAIDECYNAATEDPLFQGPRMEKARRLLLEKTLPFYRDFRNRRPDDRVLHQEEAEQWFRVANIERILVRTDQARQTYEKARELCLRLTEHHPDVSLYRHNLARTHNNLGSLLRAQGQSDRALAEYREARELFLRLVREQPAVPEYRKGLANAHNNLGTLLTDQGKSEEALAELRQAQELRIRLVRDHPDFSQYRIDLANTHFNLGILLSSQGKSDRGLAEYRQARELYLRLVREHPEDAASRKNLASVHNNLGVLLSSRGNLDEAAQEYRQARALRLELVREHPDIPEYRNGLASTHINLGALLAFLGKSEEAATEYRQARELYLRLAREHPAVPEYRNSLGSAHNNLGILLRAQGRREEAAAEYRQARDLRLRLVREHPDVPDYQKDLAGTHNNLGILLRVQGKGEEAAQEYRLARAIRHRLVREHPDVPEYRSDLAGTHFNLGFLLSSQGKNEEAATEYRQAQALFLQLMKAHPDVPEYADRLARSCLARGSLPTRIRPTEECLADLDQAISLCDRLRQLPPPHSQVTPLLLSGLTARAAILARLGRIPEADTDWDRALELAPPNQRTGLRVQRTRGRARSGDHRRAAVEADELARNPALTGSDLCSLASAHALCAVGAHRDASRPLPEREKHAEGHARQAVALLQRAAAAGYFRDPANFDHFDRDDDLAGLRGRDDFRAFRAGLGKP